MMKIEIFDVALGQCAVIHCPNGKRIMIDAGHKSGEWWPSIHFLGQTFELFINGNFDEDHASDFTDVQKHCRIKNILRNPTVTSSALKQMKSSTGGMGPGITGLHEWLQSIEHPQVISSASAPINLDLGGVGLHWFWNPYPHFNKTNDLSLAVFISYGDFTILFPGDLEHAGWENMLSNSGFRAKLAHTNVLVASHHGRDNGRCLEMSKHFVPQAVIISDAGKQHATQETVDWYAYRTSGCKSRNGNSRKVFTTRYDGKITLDVEPANRWFIDTSRNETLSAHPSLLSLAALGLPSIQPLGRPDFGIGGLAALASKQAIIDKPQQQAIPLGLLGTFLDRK